MSTFGPDSKALCKVNEVQQKPRAMGIKRKNKAKDAAAVMQREQLLGEIVGKDFYRTDSVNEGHYSKKRADVADVDPKVSPKPPPTIFIVAGQLLSLVNSCAPN